MCSVDCLKWAIKNISREDIESKSILEVGSYDVNGSLRYIIEMLRPSKYTGVDIVNGPGVDVVCSADNLVSKFGKERFDVVLSTCMLEHTRNPKPAISNIKNVCRRNGLIILIVPSKWPFHEYPSDFWRYTKKDIQELFSDCRILVLEEDQKVPSLVYAKINKPLKFVENDLSNYKLYSIVTNTKAQELCEEDLKSFRFRWLILKARLKSFLLRMFGALLE